MNDLLQIGRITGSHGVRGEVSVYSLTDDPRRFSVLKDCFLVTEDFSSKVPMKASRARIAADKVLLKLEGVDDRDAADALKGRYLAVTRENAVRLKPDTYFICDLIGCTVVDEEAGTLGVIADILQNGATDIYVVKRENAKDLLLPAIRQVVREVDIASGIVRVRLLEGLLDL